MSLEKLVQISSASSPSIYCTNPTCAQPRNDLGDQVCVTCHTPITYRYLWALGSEATQIQAGQLVGNRYYVTNPQVWLDTKPGILPLMPDALSESLPYLSLYCHRLHLPEVYGIYHFGTVLDGADILLLDNVPVDRKGSLLPSLVESWPQAKAVRQVYWLWQMLQLWVPLAEQGATYSLFVKDNLRVEGWRIRLRELHQGRVQPTLRDLAEAWSAFIETSQAQVQKRLQEIQHLMRGNPDPLEVVKPLNQLLLEQAAQLPLHLSVAGATDGGPGRSHNEDSCYPTSEDLEPKKNHPDDRLIPYLSMVCDGVGGHEGGEIAAQLAVQSIKPLIYSFIEEISIQDELYPPELVVNQLQEIARVVNNVISAQNDEQGRSAKSRMGTTLVMALQLPQTVKASADAERRNAHELYIMNVGDSRAYWMTRESCQLLTVDDSVAVRQVRMGQSLYWSARQRQDAGALTQALGTREADFLHPTVQRLIIEEDGLLLLCSDGLSDQDWVEKSWVEFAPKILQGEKSLQAAVKEWIDLANIKNGRDNVSVVLTYCGVSPQKLVLAEVREKPQVQQPDAELTEASRALMYDDESSGDTVGVPVPKVQTRKQPWTFILLGLFLLLLGIGFAVWWQRYRSNQSPDPSRETVERRVKVSSVQALHSAEVWEIDIVKGIDSLE
ncbi:MAG: PP2C family protein-serine/threonine phosphatase [Microcoleaceae cyanobacterium]